jgi:hypothetical protein
MSRGPGAIERAIEMLLTSSPDENFTVSEIARRVYGHIEVVSRSHTVSVHRALIKVLRRNPDWQWGRLTRRNWALGHGSERVLYNSSHWKKPPYE